MNLVSMSKRTTVNANQPTKQPPPPTPHPRFLNTHLRTRSNVCASIIRCSTPKTNDY